MNHLQNLYKSLKLVYLLIIILWGKLVYSLKSPIKFDKTLKVTSVPFFIPYFNLLSCELENFTFKVWYWVILYWYYVSASSYFCFPKSNRLTYNIFLK